MTKFVLACVVAFYFGVAILGATHGEYAWSVFVFAATFLAVRALLEDL